MGSIAPQTNFDVEEVLPQLTTSEKVDLLSGIDFWHTAPVHRLGVPSIRLSDGPNGVRGTRFFNGVPAACLPCGKCASCCQTERPLTQHRNRTCRNLGYRPCEEGGETPRP